MVRSRLLVLRRGVLRLGEAGEPVAIDDLDVRAGELVGLAGPSGSGKTTVLNLPYGWERPDDGSVQTFAGRDPASLGWAAVALLPQTLGLLDELTIEENARLPGCSRASASSTLLAADPASSRWAGASAAHSHGRSSSRRASCSPTSRPRIRMTAGRGRSSICCTRTRATGTPVLERCDRIVSLSSAHAGG